MPTSTEAPDGLESPYVLPSIAEDTIASVVTTDLVIRSLPEISEASRIHPTHLQEGQKLFVIDGPVSADGNAWYQVAPFSTGPYDDVVPVDPLAPIGWVASGSPSDPWILPWEGECPSADIESIWRQPAYLMLACFGDRELTLEGARGECTYVVPESPISPAWLNHAWCELMPFDVPSDAFSLGRQTLHYHVNTSSPLAFDDTQTPVRVVGHFDDPAAVSCAEDQPLSADPSVADLVILRCRAGFVATDVTEIDRP